VFILSVGALYFIVPVRAQTVSVSNLQYSSTILISKQVTVGFTASFSGAMGNYMVVAVWDQQKNTYASGSLISSNPDSCTVPSEYSWAAACTYTSIARNQGTEDVLFSLTLSSVGTYSFYAVAGILDSSGNVLADTFHDNPFSISVIDQFTLTVNAPSQVPVTLDGVPQGPGSYTTQLSPGFHAISVPVIVQLDSTSRLKFTGWSDGSTDTSRTFDLENDNELTANYVTQYRLTLVTVEGVATGDEWTDSGATAAFSIPATVPMNGTLGMLGGKYDFQGWYEGSTLITTHNSGSIVMNSAKTLTAKWSNDLTEPASIITVLIVAVGAIVVGTIYLRQNKESKPRRRRTRRKKTETQEEQTKSESDTVVVPTAESTIETPTVKAEEPKTEPSIPKPDKTQMFCTQCGAKITRDSKFCKECGAGQT